jgi:hypothetical protein
MTNHTVIQQLLKTHLKALTFQKMLIHFYIVGAEVLTMVTMTMLFSENITPCSLVKFIDVYPMLLSSYTYLLGLFFNPEDGDITFTTLLPDYTASHTRG